MTSRESKRRGGTPIDETLRLKITRRLEVKVCHRMEYDTPRLNSSRLDERHGKRSNQPKQKKSRVRTTRREKPKITEKPNVNRNEATTKSPEVNGDHPSRNNAHPKVKRHTSHRIRLEYCGNTLDPTSDCLRRGLCSWLWRPIVLFFFT